MNMSNPSVLPSNAGLVININRIAGADYGGGGGFAPAGAGMAQGNNNGMFQPQQQQFGPQQANNPSYGQYPQQYGQPNGQQYPMANTVPVNGQGMGQGVFPNGQPVNNGPNPFADLGPAPNNGNLNDQMNWAYNNAISQRMQAEQARNHYVNLANQLNQQAQQQYQQQNPGQFPQQPQLNVVSSANPNDPQYQQQMQQQQGLMQQQQQQMQQIFQQQQQTIQQLQQALQQQAQQPQQSMVPANQQQPFPTPQGEPLMPEVPAPPAGQPAPTDATVPTPAPAPAAPAPLDPSQTSQQPAGKDQPSATFKKLEAMPTPELLNTLRAIMSVPNADGSMAQQVDPNLLSLQSVQDILFLVSNRADAVKPETYSLLKQVKDMAQIMMGMTDTSISTQDKENAQFILLDTLWAAAKLDAKQAPGTPAKMLPGYSTLIEPILSGREKVPALVESGAVQAVSPDLFPAFGDPSVKKNLQAMSKRLMGEVAKSGTRKWQTLFFTKHPVISDADKALKEQTAQMAQMVLQGQSISQNPALANVGSNVGSSVASAAPTGGAAPADMMMGMPASAAPAAPVDINNPYADPLAGVPQGAPAPTITAPTAPPAGGPAPMGMPAGMPAGMPTSQAELDALMASLPPEVVAQAKAQAEQMASTPEGRAQMQQMMQGAGMPMPA